MGSRRIFRKHPCQDVGLPYMCDTRHAPDSFFFVFESDFRFFEEDCLHPEEWLGTAAHENYDAQKFFHEKRERVLNEGPIEPCTDGKHKTKAKMRKQTNRNSGPPTTRPSLPPAIVGLWERGFPTSRFRMRAKGHWSPHQSSGGSRPWQTRQRGRGRVTSFGFPGIHTAARAGKDSPRTEASS